VALSAVMVYGVIPFAPGIIGSDLNIGIFYVVAVGSFGILGTLMAGWSSNNKYALLGAFRAVAQLVSYEIPMVLAIITVVMVSGSMSTVAITESQMLANHQWWFLFSMPLTFLIFFISGVAETGRSPFDLLEAESEIIAGFHVEYSGLKFGLFMIGEYVHMFAIAALTATLFLGGWSGPFVPQLSAAVPFLGGLLGHVYFIGKTFIFVFIMMWFRGTLPRFRIDQLLDFGWKFLVPLGVANLIVTAVLVKLFQPASTGGVPIEAGPLAGLNGIFGLPVALLISNVVLLYLAGKIVRSVAQRSHNNPGLQALAAVESGS
jgi:NADH-quinone oxidoreductase subunit H